MKVPRVENLTKEIFLTEFLLPKIPVIVTDAMRNWDLEKFSPEYLKQTFGDSYVQVYNDLFDLQTIDTLATYLDDSFNKMPEDGVTSNYIRWYTQLKDVEFYWSDEVFDKLKSFWQHPYFVPNTDLAVPFSEGTETINSNESRFPYKGLFISGRGSRTRLHKDPFNSNAILCQFYGEKEIFLYSPSKEKYVMKGDDFVDLKNVDHNKFPQFAATVPDYHDTLKPGEIILFPAGWFHDVSCVSDSISITWNFVHKLEADALCNHVINNPDDSQLEILRFFLRDRISSNADQNEIVNLFRADAISI